MVRAGTLALLVPALLAVAGLATASAQVFGPPATVFGSIADSDAPIEAGLPVEAYIGDRLCGEGLTEHTGEGSARVTVYWADVVSEGQTPGCGSDGVEVRIKIGERFAPQTTTWAAGPVHLDVTFGNATPAPIPTFTPTPKREESAPAAGETPQPGSENTDETATQGNATPAGTIPVGSPGAGSPVPTLRGGLASDVSGSSGGGDGGGGFPIWAAVVIVLGGIAAVGGGVGYAMSRGNRTQEDDEFLTSE
jgi:hypothetical protein